MPIPDRQDRLLTYEAPKALVRVLRYSSRGFPVHVWEPPPPIHMPRIGNEILNCVIYLYTSVQAARDGEREGGTGFVVGVPFSKDRVGERRKRAHFYAVTNAHVIRRGAPIIRINTDDGGVDVIDLDRDSWLLHPEGDEVAACAFEPANEHVLSWISTDDVVGPQLIKDHGLGPGDDVFMIGRFKAHDGRVRNRPVVRFGSVSMMPPESIRNENDLELESFMVEMRSLSGFSGSPVFIHIQPFAYRPEYAGVRPARVLKAVMYGPWLLGIDWGHLPVLEHVLEKDAKTRTSEGYVVRSNSGIAAVAPAWKILELLDHPTFRQARAEREESVESKSDAPQAIED